MRSVFFPRLLLLGLAFVMAAGLRAQEYRGRVQGTVLDATQAAIPGARIVLLNVNTGVSGTRETDERGHYLLTWFCPEPTR